MKAAFYGLTAFCLAAYDLADSYSCSGTARLLPRGDRIWGAVHQLAYIPARAFGLAIRTRCKSRRSRLHAGIKPEGSAQSTSRTIGRARNSPIAFVLPHCADLVESPMRAGRRFRWQKSGDWSAADAQIKLSGPKGNPSTGEGGKSVDDAQQMMQSGL